MQKFTLGLNALTAILFTTFFAYTFFAETHLRSLARDYVNEKTLQYSAPVIGKIEQVLTIPLVVKYAPTEDIQFVRAEINAYRENPAAYIANLTRQEPSDPPAKNLSTIAKKTAEAKQKIREFYDNMLAALILDLRIFSGTNIAAATMAIVLTTKSRPPLRKALVAFSFLLFIAVVFCSNLYIDGLSFFSILTSSHLGWWYPFFVFASAFWLFQKVGGVIQKAT